MGGMQANLGRSNFVRPGLPNLSRAKPRDPGQDGDLSIPLEQNLDLLNLLYGMTFEMAKMLHLRPGCPILPF